MVSRLEIGHGVGNFVFPLLESNKELFIYACDYSARAVEFLKTSPSYNTERCKGFLCDLTKDSLSDNVPIESLDIVSAIFMLSAVPPFKMAYVVENIKQVLKPGGVILFRDYGLHDAAQLRFKAENRIDDCFYTRSDGTFSYYFSKEYFKNLFEPAGFEILDCGYVTKEVVNRKQDMKMDRIFPASPSPKKMNESNFIFREREREGGWASFI
ncbi:hypothetical protein BASA62_010196 [Batrachochytrium salamandrivorans]|nr:hypothetical protein BASA62_010196 [Batrachochytrium salamandrivorans]